MSDCIWLIGCFAHYLHFVRPVIRPCNLMKERYHEILDDKNNFLNPAVRESLCKWVPHQLRDRSRGSTPRELQRRPTYALCYGALVKIFSIWKSLDQKLARNPQLFLCTVLQIWVPWIQRCFTGLKTSLSYFRVELADRRTVYDWQQYKEEEESLSPPGGRQCIHSHVLVHNILYNVFR